MHLCNVKYKCWWWIQKLSAPLQPNVLQQKFKVEQFDVSPTSRCLMLVRVGPTSKVFLSEFKVYSLMLVPVCSRNQYREFRWHFLCYLILLKCIFTWKPSYSFPIRASWFLDRGGSRTWTRPGCRVSQESQIQCCNLKWWCLYYQLSSHSDAAMHGLGGDDTFIRTGDGNGKMRGDVTRSGEGGA